MAINLTLAQLKEYFKTWHENHFDDLHKVEMIKVINSYLDNKGLSNTINNINDVKKNIVKVATFLSKSIDGQTQLNNDSSLSDAINELTNNKSINTSSINLKTLSTTVNSHGNTLNNKADIDYVNRKLTSIEVSAGKTPTMLLEQEIPVQSEKNLNNYTTPGLYKSKTSAITNTLSNKPNLSSPFTLIVIRHADNGVRQILIAGDTSNNGNKIYMRNYVNGSWSSQWHELYGTHNTTPFQMQVEFANGSTQTYTLLQKL